jgi:hypothetical protein
MVQCGDLEALYIIVLLHLARSDASCRQSGNFSKSKHVNHVFWEPRYLGSPLVGSLMSTYGTPSGLHVALARVSQMR